VALDDVAPNHAEARQHHLHRVRYDVLGGPALETVDPDRRHAAAATLMEADREIVLLGCAPEPVVVGVGPQEAAAHAQFPASKLHLLDRVLDGLHRQHRDAE
jgi:hypothetical protein